MSDQLKNTVWDIDILQNVLHKRVCFEEPVTKDEAIEMFLEGSYYDILDFEMGAVEEVYNAEMVGDPDEDEEEDGYDED